MPLTHRMHLRTKEKGAIGWCLFHAARPSRRIGCVTVTAQQALVALWHNHGGTNLSKRQLLEIALKNITKPTIVSLLQEMLAEEAL